MTTFTRRTESRIVFDDGRKGKQIVDHFSDGSSELTETVVTHRADGSRCRVVYARRSDIQARVFSLSDLTPATWEIDDTASRSELDREINNSLGPIS